MIELLNHTNPDQSSSWYRWLIMHKKWKGINFVTVTFVDRSLSFVVTIQYAPHRHRWKHTPQGPTASTCHSVINSVSDWHPVSFQASEWLFNLFQKIFFLNPSEGMWLIVPRFVRVWDEDWVSVFVCEAHSCVSSTQPENLTHMHHFLCDWGFQIVMGKIPNFTTA